LISELHLDERVFLMGRHKDVHERIKDASLYILTSHYEGMPNALMESMALGLPCISVDCSGGGPKALINNGINGVLISNNDEISLSQQIAMLLKNRMAINNISKNAISVRKEYAIEIVGNKWLDYIINLWK